MTKLNLVYFQETHLPRPDDEVVVVEEVVLAEVLADDSVGAGAAQELAPLLPRGRRPAPVLCVRAGHLAPEGRHLTKQNKCCDLWEMGSL